MTIDEFLTERFDFPESGQWSELEAGEPVHLQPPDLDHGNVILNLSKAIAAWIERVETAYACFDLGLVLSREPDTIRFPAACFFTDGPRFAETDKEATETIPHVVVELASSSDRRELMADRVRKLIEHGVDTVWVIDPRARTIDVATGRQSLATFDEQQTLSGDPWLPGLTIKVADLFVEPRWWTGQRR